MAFGSGKVEGGAFVIVARPHARSLGSGFEGFRSSGFRSFRVGPLPTQIL